MISMKPLELRLARPSTLALTLAFGATALFANQATAAVTQPDGTVMPLKSPDNEVALQDLFDFKEGVGVLDAVADASTEPATFKPLCDFSAQLLLHETASDAAVGWYNSPAGDVPPTTVCNEDTGMSSGGGPCTESDIFPLIPGNVVDPPFGKAANPLEHPGQIFTGEDLAQSPYYAGGSIGFVLLTGQKHYSEARLNPACTGDTCTDGDRWIPTIMYASKTNDRSYYMCSEDQNVGPSKWGNNDGDFNDFVFLFKGLVCTGAGEPCDTGQPGICAAGLTDCANAEGESECRPARTAGEETCNGLDDDCNGDADEGDLCPEGELCVRARCVPKCGTGEFRCDADEKCVEGACIEAACVSVDCAAGKVCMGGKCVGACDEVSCPGSQTCVEGVCVDPCAGIDCGQGFVCEAGACRVECACAGCEEGECDTDTGHCVDEGCAGVVCEAGEHCADGDCVNDCLGVSCPDDGECFEGQCLPPASGVGGDAGVGGAIDPGPDPDPGVHFGGEGPGSEPADGGVGAGGFSGGGGSGGRSGGSNAVEVESGCACRAPAGNSGATAAWLALAAAAVLGARRRRHSQ
jgi:MYXO-CTERM domain-containing protein